MTAINYEGVAWMQPLKSKDGKKFLMLGKVTNPEYPNTFAVTPEDGKGETMFFCIKHEVAYGLKGFCLDCRMQTREEPAG